MEEIEAWLVRDKDNTLMLVIGAKPVKLFQIAWGYSPNGNSMELDRELFPEVQWSDEEPTKVKIVIDK